MQLNDPSPLIGERVTLRRWSFNDLDCIEEASRDPRIPAGTTVPAAFTPAAGRSFIERQWSRFDNAEGISLAIHANEIDRAVGLVVMLRRPQPGVIGLGYWIVPSARRFGYATVAATLASTWAITSGGFARIEAWVEPDNYASQHVLSAAGFDNEGRLRSFLTTGSTRSDALVYSRVAP